MRTNVIQGCEQFRERLAAHAAGELEGNERLSLERHLAACTRCAEELADLKIVLGVMRDTPMAVPPETLLPKVRLALRDKAPAPGTRLLWPRLAIPVAVLTGLIAVTFALRAPKQQFLPGEAPFSAGGASEAQVEAARRASAGEERQRAQQHGAPLTPITGKPGLVTPPAPPIRLGQPHVGQIAGARTTQDTDTFAKASVPATEEPTARTEQSHYKASVADSAPATADRAAAGMEKAGGGMGGGGARSGMRSGRSIDQSEFPHPSSPAGPRGPDALAAILSPQQTQAIILQSGLKPMIGVEVPGTGGDETFTYRIGASAPNKVTWRSQGQRAAVLPLPTEQLGAGPAALPLEIVTSQATRHYTLYIPIMSRLGQVAPKAHQQRYANEKLGSVLLDYATMTGLVVLSDAPKDVRVTGPTPTGPPAASLRELAAANGLTAQTQGDFVVTVTQTQQ